MKKMYDKTVWGYYVMSVVLGLLLALSVALVLEVALLDAIMSSSPKVADMLDKAWGYLPLGLDYVFYGTQGQAVLMVTAAIMTVGIFVRMSATKGSRTKMLQAVAVAVLVLLLMLAYRYALRGRISDVLALVPVLLMVIPLTILRKTQQPFETGIWATRVSNACFAVRRLASKHEQATGIVVVFVALAFYLVVAAIIHHPFG